MSEKVEESFTDEQIKFIKKFTDLNAANESMHKYFKDNAHKHVHCINWHKSRTDLSAPSAVEQNFKNMLDYINELEAEKLK